MNFGPPNSSTARRYKDAPLRATTESAKRTGVLINKRPHAVPRVETLKKISTKPQVVQPGLSAPTPSTMFSMASNGYKSIPQPKVSHRQLRGNSNTRKYDDNYSNVFSNVSLSTRSSELRNTQNIVSNEPENIQKQHQIISKDAPVIRVEVSFGFIKPAFAKLMNLTSTLRPKFNTSSKSKGRGFSNIKRQQALLFSAAGFVFILGVTASLFGFRANTHVEAQAAQMQSATTNEVATTTADAEETEISPSVIAQHVVPTDHPKRITIAKTKTNARVLGLGLKGGKQLDAPKNIFDVGWYDKSAKPGSGGGAVLLDGHVSGKRKKGVFYNLNSLISGDVIQIERGDGQIIDYQVVKIEAYPHNDVDMTAAMLPVENGKEGLNIITCHGDVSAGSYEERLVVFAVRI